MVDVAPEKVLGNIPKAIRESILSEIEKKTVEMKNDENAKGFSSCNAVLKRFFHTDYR